LLMPRSSSSGPSVSDGALPASVVVVVMTPRLRRSLRVAD
jgi:hypothetical protein